MRSASANWGLSVHNLIAHPWWRHDARDSLLKQCSTLVRWDLSIGATRIMTYILLVKQGSRKPSRTYSMQGSRSLWWQKFTQGCLPYELEPIPEGTLFSIWNGLAKSDQPRMGASYQVWYHLSSTWSTSIKTKRSCKRCQNTLVAAGPFWLIVIHLSSVTSCLQTILVHQSKTILIRREHFRGNHTSPLPCLMLTLLAPRLASGPNAEK